MKLAYEVTIKYPEETQMQPSVEHCNDLAEAYRVMDKARGAGNTAEITKAVEQRLTSTQPTLKHSASYCTCGHSETEHVGEHFESDPVHICTSCECRNFKQLVRA